METLLPLNGFHLRLNTGLSSSSLLCAELLLLLLRVWLAAAAIAASPAAAITAAADAAIAAGSTITERDLSFLEVPSPRIHPLADLECLRNDEDLLLPQLLLLFTKKKLDLQK
jgi:hypothetical protein